MRYGGGKRGGGGGVGLRDPHGGGCQPRQHVVSGPPRPRGSSSRLATWGPSSPPRRLLQPAIGIFTFIITIPLGVLFHAMFWHNMVAATMVIFTVVGDNRSSPSGVKRRKGRLESGCSLLCRPLWGGSQPVCCSLEVVLGIGFIVLIIIIIYVFVGGIIVAVSRILLPVRWVYFCVHRIFFAVCWGFFKRWWIFLGFH